VCLAIIVVKLNASIRTASLRPVAH
jgi:hypothetical protein